ncbi:MAG: helix-turn-helix domain-containing protein [Propionibacteriaceae bacterium]|nr:helix-turn-helix domain-containing protein [Propionibacteriaceae bacterium]
MSKPCADSITSGSARAVAAAIQSAGRTKRSVSDESGVPYSTLNRKLEGKADFTFRELYALAEALDVEPSAFIAPACRLSPQSGSAAEDAA